MQAAVQFFKQLSPELFSAAGGKAGMLARLSQSGVPVPDGFVILTAAFVGDELTPSAWAQVQECLVVLRRSGKPGAFAVRSSALSEDSAEASFAGEFETLLNVRGDEEVRQAIRTVRASGLSDRVEAYSRAKGIDRAGEMAVIVQQMVIPEYAGVLFTADPVSGSRAKMTGSYVPGLGDKLISGEVDAEGFEFQRPRGGYSGPEILKRYARKLYRLAARLEKELGQPQDIEWAAAGGKVYLLQSRPITTLTGRDRATGEWNDTFTGDYLWSNVNFGEAVTQPMTPLAWSVLQFSLDDWVFLPGFPTVGSIGGNPYLNISIFSTLFRAMGRSQADLLAYMESTLYMKLPEEMSIPLIPLSPANLPGMISSLLQMQIKQRLGINRLPGYLETNLSRFRHMRAQLEAASSRAGLLDVWMDQIAPHIKQGVWTVLGTVAKSTDYTMALYRRLAKLAGAEDAAILISNPSEGDELLPSLGLTIGLARVAAGEISRAAYLEDYGHRGPHEFEISVPRPVEDPAWLDEQVAQYRQSPLDVDVMLDKKSQAFDGAWTRFVGRYPRKGKTVRRKLKENARRIRLREEARSAYVRDRWLARLFALRVGENTGIGEDVFYLYLDEVFAVLQGDETTLAYIPPRKNTHQRNLELPAFPSIIRGRFSPSQWAADPERRSDLYDAQAGLSFVDLRDRSDFLTGAPGSAGRVEGVVRVLKDPRQGKLLRQGEILVTTQTDIAWTVLFPRAAAIITDIGAPLSHAAIVARELGIPAVVGCGDATMRLRTGDRVRVDGGSGLVEIISRSAG